MQAKPSERPFLVPKNSEIERFLPIFPEIVPIAHNIIHRRGLLDCILSKHDRQALSDMANLIIIPALRAAEFSFPDATSPSGEKTDYTSFEYGREFTQRQLAKMTEGNCSPLAETFKDVDQRETALSASLVLEFESKEEAVQFIQKNRAHLREMASQGTVKKDSKNYRVYLTALTRMFEPEENGVFRGPVSGVHGRNS